MSGLGCCKGPTISTRKKKKCLVKKKKVSREIYRCNFLFVLFCFLNVQKK